METQASNHLITPFLSSQDILCIMYKMCVCVEGGRGDSILMPVLAKLCRLFLTPLLDFFMNGLVSIFVDALSDNLTKVLRESSGF